MGGARGPEQAVVQKALGRRVMSGGSFAAPHNPLLFVLSLWLDNRNIRQEAPSCNDLLLQKQGQTVLEAARRPCRTVRGSTCSTLESSTRSIPAAQPQHRLSRQVNLNGMVRARRKRLLRQNSFAESSYAGLIHVHDMGLEFKLLAELVQTGARHRLVREVVSVLLDQREKRSCQRCCNDVRRMQRYAQTRRLETHHAEEGPPQSVPKVVASIAEVGPAEVGISSFPLAVLDHLFPRHLTLQRREQVFGRFVVAPNVEARHAEVVDRASEGWAEVERFPVRLDGVFRVARVGQGRAESVPEKEVLGLFGSETSAFSDPS